MAQWEYLTITVPGRVFRGPVRAEHIQEALDGAAAGDWELQSAVPVTQLGFTSSVWLLMRRRAVG